MIEELDDAGAAARAAFDDVVDVRSPAEFAQDHVPGAINLPVLSDAERAEVGTTYVRTSRFLARRVGAAHVSRNIAAHLETALADKTGAWRPLIYCWRGGQRSAAMATVLSQVGWRVGLLRGGYRTYRRDVVRALYEDARPLRLVLLRGPTGSGKTALLARLGERGTQVVDLEALAAHRGSAFGGWSDAPQPSQKMFESRLAATLETLDPARPVVVEAESSRIGELRLPLRLWKAMQAAPAVDLQTPLAARVRRIVADYGDSLDQPERIEAALARLPRHHSLERRALWRAWAAAGDADALAEDLLREHYDPAYARNAAPAGGLLGAVRLAGGSRDDLDAAAKAAGALIGRL